MKRLSMTLETTAVTYDFDIYQGINLVIHLLFHHYIVIAC